jgi:ribosomal protein L37E
MNEATDRVCNRCGERAGEQRFCSTCGLNLAAQPELPTRGEWETARSRYVRRSRQQACWLFAQDYGRVEPAWNVPTSWQFRHLSFLAAAGRAEIAGRTSAAQGAHVAVVWPGFVDCQTRFHDSGGALPPSDEGLERSSTADEAGTSIASASGSSPAVSGSSRMRGAGACQALRSCTRSR